MKDNGIFTFPAGLPGLSRKMNKFVLSSINENPIFLLLQSLDDDNIAFILINPFILYPEYEFDLPGADKDLMGIDDPENIAVLCIVNASKGFHDATVNLLAPIVFNITNNKAHQVVLNDKRYNLRHPLPDTRMKVAGEG